MESLAITVPTTTEVTVSEQSVETACPIVGVSAVIVEGVAGDLKEVVINEASPVIIAQTLATTIIPPENRLTITIQELGESAAKRAEDAASGVEVSLTAAQESELKAYQWAEELENVPVETGKFSARHHAAKAAVSALAASNGSAGVEFHAENAAASEVNAKASEDNAKASELAAVDAEHNAEVLLATVGGLQTDTQAITDLAETYKNDAAVSASEANDSAIAAAVSEVAIGQAEINATTSAANAATSEANASTSEANASNSATVASDSATAAGASEIAAEGYASDALQSKIDAEAAAAAAEGFAEHDHSALYQPLSDKLTGISGLSPTSNASHITMDTDGNISHFNWPTTVTPSNLETLNGIGSEPIISQLAGKSDTGHAHTELVNSEAFEDGYATDPDSHYAGTIITSHANAPSEFDSSTNYWYIIAFHLSGSINCCQIAIPYHGAGSAVFTRHFYLGWSAWQKAGQEFDLRSVAASADPDGFGPGLEITNHAKGPDGGVSHYFITTYQYAGNAYRSQTALSFNKATPEMWMRTEINTVWSNWVAVGSGSSSGMAWTSTITATAAANTGYLVDTSGAPVTINLPVTPSNGDTIWFCDLKGTCGTNNITVGCNGKTIMGLFEDMTISTNNVTIALVYASVTGDWRITSVTN